MEKLKATELCAGSVRCETGMDKCKEMQCLASITITVTEGGTESFLGWLENPMAYQT